MIGPPNHSPSRPQRRLELVARVGVLEDGPEELAEPRQAVAHRLRVDLELLRGRGHVALVAQPCEQRCLEPRAREGRLLGERRKALAAMRGAAGPPCVYVETDRHDGVPSCAGWWDVPVAEVSDDPAVQAARREYERAREAQRPYVDTP